MLRSLITLALLVPILVPSSYGQEVILYESVSMDSTEDDFGPGRRHFLHPFVSFGTSASNPMTNAPVLRLWGSFLFDLGLRYKFKIHKRWEMGVGLKYARESFRISQVDDKRVFGNEHHKKEKLILNDMSGAVFNRFVFGKRGDFVGTFLDLGVYMDLSLRKKHLTVDKVPKPKTRGHKEVEVVRKGLTFVRDSHYGFFARFGYNRWVLFARYRRSDLFTEGEISSDYPELGRIQTGVQIGLHR